MTSKDIVWSDPPPPTQEGAVPFVDFRYAVFKVDEVDTASLSVRVKVAVVWYWTDPRLAGWGAKPLPPDLWGPHIAMVNAQDMSDEQTQFELSNAETGRLKRGRLFYGTVSNHMDLRQFPFDMDSIDIIFESVSHYMTLDESMKGSMPKGKSYRLRPTCLPGEGKIIGIYWSGAIIEWQLLGCSWSKDELPPTPQGSERTKLSLNFHVSRQSGFYLWKVLLPLLLLGVLCFSAFEFDSENVSDRQGTVATYFLSALAMLYVVGQYLPRADYLTQMDKVIGLTTMLNAVIGLEARLVAWIVRTYSYELAESVDLWLEVVLAVGYPLGLLVLLAPPWYNREVAKAALVGDEKQRPPPFMQRIGSTTMLMTTYQELETTVQKGHTYISLAELQGVAPPQKPAPAPALQA